MPRDHHPTEVAEAFLARPTIAGSLADIGRRRFIADEIAYRERLHQQPDADELAYRRRLAAELERATERTRTQAERYGDFIATSRPPIATQTVRRFLAECAVEVSETIVRFRDGSEIHRADGSLGPVAPPKR